MEKTGYRKNYQNHVLQVQIKVRLVLINKQSTFSFPWSFKQNFTIKKRWHLAVTKFCTEQG